MVLRSFNSFAWLGIALIGAGAMAAPSVGCDTSFVPPSNPTSETGGTSGATTNGSSSSSNASTSGSGSGGSSVGSSSSSSSSIGSSSSGSSSGGGSSSSSASSSSSSGGGSSSVDSTSSSSSSGGGSSSSSSSGGGNSAGGSSAGGSSAGGSGGADSGVTGSGTPPTTLYCPAGRSLTYYLNFTDPNWQKGVDFTFGNGLLKQSKNNGQTDDNISVVQDPTKGQVLKVLYRVGSGPNSCFTCVADGATPPACLCNTSGGAEFYADFAKGRILEYAFLSYWVRFGDTVGAFDWGLAGKMPGLSGGIPVHGLNIVNGSGFTARGMWRANVCGGKSSELYWYGLPVGSSNTDQCGTGPAWSWQPDAKWHQVQMQLKMSTGVAYNGTMQLWYDKPATATPDINVTGLGMLDRTKFPMNSVSQLMFSTFYGGHDNTWGPKADTTAYFADFQICN